MYSPFGSPVVVMGEKVIFPTRFPGKQMNLHDWFVKHTIAGIPVQPKQPAKK